LSAAAILAWGAPAIIASFVVAELVARVVLRIGGRYFVWTPYSRVRMHLDRDVFPALDPEVRFDVNEDGERGDMLPPDWSRTYRILVAGGSAAECYYLDQDSTWPQVIQRALSRADNLRALGVARVHVGNVSRSLVACRHVHSMLERILPRYSRLDAIVFMVGASDVVHWLERRTPPVIEDEVIPPSQLFGKHPEGPFGWGPRTLALRRIASYWNKRLRRPIEVRDRVGKRLALARAMRARANEIVDDVPDPEPMLEHFGAEFRRLVELAKRHAKRVIVVRQPWFDKAFTPDEEKRLWNFGAGRPYAEEVTTYYSHAVVWRLMRRVDELASRLASELGVEQIDLMPVLPRSFEIYYDELHHTPKGCDLVGENVARAIVARK
jgi:hypothetical protein